jgi:hypothetical protein
MAYQRLTRYCGSAMRKLGFLMLLGLWLAAGSTDAATHWRGSGVATPARRRMQAPRIMRRLCTAIEHPPIVRILTSRAAMHRERATGQTASPALSADALNEAPGRRTHSAAATRVLPDGGFRPNPDIQFLNLGARDLPFGCAAICIQLVLHVE